MSTNTLEKVLWDTTVNLSIAAHGLNAMDDEEIIENGGNGGLEIKNWIATMGAYGPAKDELKGH